MVRVLSLSGADVSTRALTPGLHVAAFGVWLGSVGGEAPSPNQYLYLLIGLSPLPPAHPSTFQRKPVRPSSACHGAFSLAGGRSQSFASAAADSYALFGHAFAPGPGLKALALAGDERLVGSLCKRHAVTP